MASYYTYGAVPTAEETVFGPLSSGYADGGEVDDLIPQAPPEDPMRGVSGPEMFRWSDGTYHFMPEGSGQRTPIDQLPDYYRRLTEEALAKSPLESSPGPGLGGDEPVYTPRGEDVPVTPLASAAPPPPPAAAQYDEKGNLLASSDSPLSQMSGGTPDWIKRMQAFGAAPSLVQNLVNIGTGGTDIAAGNLYKVKKDQAIKSFEERLKSVEAGGYLTPEVEQSLKDNLSYELEQISAGESAYLNSLPQRQVLSDLLKNNQFSEAIKYAQDNGMQTLLTRPDELSNLRQPFTKDEARQFMRSLTPEFFKSAYGDQYEYDKAWKFDPEGAEERGALAWVSGAGTPGMAMSETGYPMLDRVLKAQELRSEKGSVFEKIFKAAAIAAAVFGGAQLLGALGSAGGAGAAGAGTAGAGAAGGAGAGAAGAGLSGAAAGAGGLSAAQLASVLPEVVITASKVSPLLAGAGAAGAGLAASELAGMGSKAAVAQPSTQVPPTDGLEEVVVQAAKRGPYSLLGPGTLASTSLMTPGSISDIPTDIYGQPTEPTEITEPAEQTQKKPFEDRLEEVVVTGSKYKPGIIDLGAIGTGGLTAAQLMQGFTEPTLRPYEELPPEGGPIEEVVVTGSKPPPIDLMDVGIGGLTAAQLMQGYTQPNIGPYEQVATEPSPEETKQPFEDRLDEVVVTGSRYQPGILDLGAIGTGGLTAAELLKGFTEPSLRPYEELPPEGEPIEEVVVTGSKPPPIDLMDVGIGGLTAAQLMQGFTQPKVDPFTGEPKEPPKTEQELDKIQAALKAGTPIPGTSSFLKDLISKYGTLENALKVLGALGAGAAKGPKMPTGGAGAGTGGMGGALPKYTYARQQLSPDIDYYTYGTRPEARFFEQGLKLEQPTQPEPPQGPPSKPPVEEPVFATGGLTGYAKGGSKSSRYVDGPGSGRDDKIPALLSDGEYVIDAETLALLGDGSTKEGARRMDKFRAKIRKHKGRALSRGRISPNAKSPEKYMGGGLT
jgi:hypothetical protein